MLIAETLENTEKYEEKSVIKHIEFHIQATILFFFFFPLLEHIFL